MPFRLRKVGVAQAFAQGAGKLADTFGVREVRDVDAAFIALLIDPAERIAVGRLPGRTAAVAGGALGLAPVFLGQGPFGQCARAFAQMAISSLVLT